MSYKHGQQSDIPVSSKWQSTLMVEFKDDYEESFLKGKDTHTQFLILFLNTEVHDAGHLLKIMCYTCLRQL